jgi:predicted metal-dependent HD superfamily phosphohydrolase
MMNPCELFAWQTLWASLGARGDAEPWHQRLLAAYAEPQRHYHNRQHLEECLAELANADVKSESRRLIGTALWFHDAVYDPRSATNEEDSAQLADKCLTGAGVALETVEAIQRLVLATRTHESDGRPDAALLLDIDLAILGQALTRFWQYEDAIRAEYAWVPLEIFRVKRAEILHKFLQRPFLYQTESFQTRYETAARANLAAAIARLET